MPSPGVTIADDANRPAPRPPFGANLIGRSELTPPTGITDALRRRMMRLAISA